MQETGRVFQVGTQQRSENENRFLKAIAIVQSGRLGKKVNAHVAIGGGEVGGPFPQPQRPKASIGTCGVGAANAADYSTERRKEFRWYFDYSGGKMTDWGAHHIDIAQWALGHDHSGPVKITGKGKFTPIVPDKFDWIEYFAGQSEAAKWLSDASQVRHRLANTTTVRCSTCAMNTCRDDGKTKFTERHPIRGREGRIFVNREKLTGKPVEEMTKPRRRSSTRQVVEALHGKQPAIT